MDKKPSPMWLNKHPILDESHAHELEQNAAIGEFHRQQTRDQAEHNAYSEYTKKHHEAAAAHHYAGLKASAQDPEEAKKHGAFYTLHMKAAGHDPIGPVPEHIRLQAEDPGQSKVYRFSPHAADAFLGQHLGKSELAKGTVIPFPVDRVPPSTGDLGEDAQVTRVPQKGAMVVDPATNTPKQVTNLGWLLRNWKHVNNFDLSTQEDGTGHMVAHMRSGHQYQTPWASHSLMADWINRPVFRGIATTIDGKPYQWPTKKSECPLKKSPDRFELLDIDGLPNHNPDKAFAREQAITALKGTTAGLTNPGTLRGSAAINARMNELERMRAAAAAAGAVAPPAPEPAPAHPAPSEACPACGATGQYDACPQCGVYCDDCRDYHRIVPVQKSQPDLTRLVKAANYALVLAKVNAGGVLSKAMDEKEEKCPKLTCPACRGSMIGHAVKKGRARIGSDGYVARNAPWKTVTICAHHPDPDHVRNKTKEPD